MTTQTDNLELYKPEEGNTDWATEINANWDTIDAGVEFSKVIVKSADEYVTSSTTLQDDNDFTLSVASGKTYAYEMWLSEHMDASGDIKFTFTMPTLADSLVNVHIVQVNNSWNHVLERGDFAMTDTLSLLVGSDGNYEIKIWGSFTTSAAGTLQFQWAQNSSHANPTYIRKGSWMKVTEESS
jgi:hypothetical protein